MPGVTAKLIQVSRPLRGRFQSSKTTPGTDLIKAKSGDSNNNNNNNYYNYNNNNNYYYYQR